MSRLGATATWILVSKLVRFGSVGLLCNLLYSGLIILLLRFTNLIVQFSHIIAFISIVPISYYLQRSFTFRYAGSDRQSLPRFAAASLSAWLVSTAAVVVAKDWYDLSNFAIIAIVIVIVPGMSFVAMLLWVFVDHKPASASAPQTEGGVVGERSKTASNALAPDATRGGDHSRQTETR